jgi:hypothetical protein
MRGKEPRGHPAPNQRERDDAIERIRLDPYGEEKRDDREPSQPARTFATGDEKQRGRQKAGDGC